MDDFLMHYTAEKFWADFRKVFSEMNMADKSERKESLKPEYLTRKEVSEKLHVSLPTLNRFHKAGILTARKIGGRVLYLLSDIERVINQGQSLKYSRTNRFR